MLTDENSALRMQIMTLNDVNAALVEKIDSMVLQNDELKRVLAHVVRGYCPWCKLGGDGHKQNHFSDCPAGKLVGEVVEKPKCGCCSYPHMPGVPCSCGCHVEKRSVSVPNDKSGGDAARCGKCGKFYVDHADDDCHG